MNHSILFNDNVHFYASPRDAEHLLQHSIELLTEQVYAIKKAEIYCQKIARSKENNEQPAFLALAKEYQQLIQNVFHQLTQLRGILS